jgi:hypothetical protein
MHACKHPKLIPLTFPITIIQGGRQENHGKQSSRESVNLRQIYKCNLTGQVLC